MKEKDYLSVDEIVNVAKNYDVDQSDMLETFLCELLNITPTELYERIANE